MPYSGMHPEELSQSIVIMPDEHVPPPTEVCFLGVCRVAVDEWLHGHGCGPLFLQTLYPQDLEIKRSVEEFYDFVPYAFTRRAAKKPEDYPPERCVTTLKMVWPLLKPAACRGASVPYIHVCFMTTQLSSPDTAHILKVQLEDLVSTLGERTLATLGPLLSSFRNLEVLILRNCGVESVRTSPGWHLRAFLLYSAVCFCCQLDRFVMPSLVYLDLTLNRINDLSSVCEFARNTLDIVHLDLTANPLLSRSQWKVRRHRSCRSVIPSWSLTDKFD